MEKEKLRLDKYLWAIRLFKTRTAAATACDKGRVKIDGESVKASRVVKIDDTYEVKTDEKRWVIKVTGLLPKECNTVKPSNFMKTRRLLKRKKELHFKLQVFIQANAFQKIGRPTKKERRDIDDFMEGTE